MFVSVIEVHLVWCAFRYMGFDLRKPVSGFANNKGADQPARIRAGRSAPLLFAYCKVSYLDLHATSEIPIF